MDLGLRDKVALVMAASRGLGKASAHALAAEGARVAITARGADTLNRTAREIRDATGSEILPIVADVTRGEDISRAVADTVATFGGLDILVTNAGGPRPGPFTSLSEQDWRDAIELTLMSVVRLAMEAVPRLRARGGGRIINITSASTKQPIEGLMLSNALRGAVVGFAKTLATELAQDGILVTSVAPGFIRTDRAVEIAEEAAHREGVSTSEINRRLTAGVPLGRMGEPAELGDVVAFLASERARYITGVTLIVDGGLVRAV